MKYYWPDRGETLEDARDVPNCSASDRFLQAVNDICGRDFYEESWKEDILIIVDDDGVEHRFHVEAEPSVDFYVREQPPS